MHDDKGRIGFDKQNEIIEKPLVLAPSVMKQLPVYDGGMEEEVDVTATNYVNHKCSFSNASGRKSKYFSSKRPFAQLNPKPVCAQAST